MDYFESFHQQSKLGEHLVRSSVFNFSPQFQQNYCMNSCGRAFWPTGQFNSRFFPCFSPSEAPHLVIMEECYHQKTHECPDVMCLQLL